MREKHDDRAMASWVRDFSARLEKRLLLIAGHTHRPVFGSELLEVRVRAELAAERDEPEPDKSVISDLSAKLEWLRAWRDWRDPHEFGQAPAYFNTGCCAFPDGSVTGIELADAQIRLIRWPERTPVREELACAELADVFNNVAAAGGPLEPESPVSPTPAN